MTKRMIYLVWLGVLFLLIGKYIQLHTTVFIIYNSILACLYVLDVRLSPKKDSFNVERIYDPLFEIGKEKNIFIQISNYSDKEMAFQVKDTVPAELESGKDIMSALCAPGQIVSVSYKVKPVKRGSYTFGDVFIRYKGVLGLCTREFRVSLQQNISVYPDLYPMKRYHLLAKKRLLDRHDNAVHKDKGMGTDFQYLREYTTDDEYRKINWKATARAHKLITGEYGIEKNQNVLICIDTGRVMISPAGKMTRLDHSIESALVLAQVAMDQGDRVGLLVFRDDVKLFLKPDKGPAQLNKILDALYPLQPAYYESSFHELVDYLQKHQRKRSFVCIFSHLRDEESCKELAQILYPINKKHALMMVSILNPGLKDELNRPAEDMHHLYIKAAASYRIDTERNASFLLSKMGITNVLTEPNHLTPEVVNRYIAIKKKMGIS
ncbi:MAG: DUF58 domain-containing protein [Clostridiaceae bacterium]|nr:DUF58 domain-containing protein [Clostridiaceae bacterium]